MGAKLKGLCISCYRSEGREQAKGRRRKRESEGNNSISVVLALPIRATYTGRYLMDISC